MAVITIDSGVFCHSEEVARRVAEQLGYRILTETEVLTAAAERFGVSADKLGRIMHGPQSFFSSFTRDREKGVVYLRAALAAAIAGDEVVHAGPAGHLLPKSLNHVLKVCLAATADYRAEQGQREGRSQREAEKAIRKDDEARAEWTGHLFELGPWEKSLYDVFLPMSETSVEEAVALICDSAGMPAVKTTAASGRAIDDLLLACEVELALVEQGHAAEVQCARGEATILINKETMFLDRLERELEEIASTVPGVSAATARPGPRYRAADISFNIDLELPSKILLVDDEKEFVRTLSERLQAREMAPAIAFDGEEALAMAESDEPEVMVLDLKMPGIDGLEVLRRVKKKHPATEVIILTGHGSEAEESLAAELGAFAYLRKPVDIDVLTATMKEAYRKVQQARNGSQ